MFFRSIYTLIFFLLLPLMVLRLLWRSIKAPDYRRRIGERFGFFARPRWGRSSIWVHSVSVGETLAAKPLVKALLQNYPDTPLLITTTTPTGSAQVQRLYANEIKERRVFHVYSPYDLPWCINRLIRRTYPKTLVLMETELWPNMLHCCAEKGISVILANARLSEKSMGGYRRLSSLTRSMLEDIYAVAAQFTSDAERFAHLGMSPERLRVTGSIKFDLQLSPDHQKQALHYKQQWSCRGQRPVWLAASTHPGEDELVLRCFTRLKQAYPNLLLVLVPRHPERFDTVFAQCQQVSSRCLRLSASIAPDQQTDILLIDEMGLLLSCYGACDLAFVGGSMVPVGGHNLVEPAVWGKPIVSGPHLRNFDDISRLLIEKNALLLCDDENKLYERLHQLLADEQLRLLMGKNAMQVALHNRGGLQKLLSLIDQAITLWKAKYPSVPWA